MSNKNLIERESNFELLRIICMFVIILYHLIRFFIEGEHPDDLFWSAIQLPLHIGVIVFVLISGYFGINTSAKGIARLLVLTFIYYTPMVLLQSGFNLFEFISAYGIKSIFTLESVSYLKDFILSFLFISHGPYWFVRTYLWLYLLAPAINTFINKSNNHLLYTILITGAISLYMGLVNGLDPSLRDGNNIINFIFIYGIGRLLHIKQEWKNMPLFKFVLLYFVLNILLFTSFYYTKGRYLGDIIYKLFFPYDSIGLLFNSLIIFMIFGKMQIRSTAINSIATSTFAMYLFHHNPIVLYKIIKPLTLSIDSAFGGAFVEFIALILLSIVIIMVTVIVDRLIRPIYSLLETWISSLIVRLSPIVSLKNGFGK